MVKKRVPESEVEDIVQAALAEAVESPHAPTEGEALRRWIFGVAKNKVVDFHRRRGRESFDLPDVAGSDAPHLEADLLRWAERNLPEGDEAQKTLDWMLREGEGEKLESIAAAERVPAPRVRQRVSRLRKHLRAHWQREIAILAALGVAVAIVFWLRKREPEIIVHDAVPSDPPAERLRRDALAKCDAAEWRACLDGLDAAKRLDPAGDARTEVRAARALAEKATAPAPTPAPPSPSTSPPSPLPSSVPSGKTTTLTPPTKPISTEPLPLRPPPKAQKDVKSSEMLSEPPNQAPLQKSQMK